MGVLAVSTNDQYLRASGDTTLLEVYDALPEGLFPPFPPAELPGGLNGWLQRGGFAQNFFLGSEVLGLTFLSHKGRKVTAGGLTVKNVQGYDLVRPFVGSFGLLGQALEVTLRLRPGKARCLLTLPGTLEDLTPELLARPQFIWQENEQVMVYCFGHPRSIERLQQQSGGSTRTDRPDYRPWFTGGMGVGTGPLRDLRFQWQDRGAAPAAPDAFVKWCQQF
jgi:glycolate oxidase FAD binding subunit